MANHSSGEELYKTSMEASAEDAGRPRSMELVTGGADSSLEFRRKYTSLPTGTLSQVQLIAAGQVSTRHLMSSLLARDAQGTVDMRRQGG